MHTLQVPSIWFPGLSTSSALSGPCPEHSQPQVFHSFAHTQTHVKASLDDGLTTDDVSVDTLKEGMSKLNLLELDQRAFHEEPAGPLTILDLPLYELPPAVPVLKCVAEITLDASGCPRIEGMRFFPPPFGLKVQPSCPCTLDLAVIEQANRPWPFHTVQDPVTGPSRPRRELPTRKRVCGAKHLLLSDDDLQAPLAQSPQSTSW